MGELSNVKLLVSQRDHAVIIKNIGFDRKTNLANISYEPPSERHSFKSHNHPQSCTGADNSDSFLDSLSVVTVSRDLDG
jgi:hypothetical protein